MFHQLPFPTNIFFSVIFLRNIKKILDTPSRHDWSFEKLWCFSKVGVKNKELAVGEEENVVKQKQKKIERNKEKSKLLISQKRRSSRKLRKMSREIEEKKYWRKEEERRILNKVIKNNKKIFKNKTKVKRLYSN